ncbi:MAG TPA: hypothetical protein VEI02_12825 [Planctomycetota bacterium]|nr:hypothetical protein [Planctomycetota bacterium]
MTLAAAQSGFTALVRARPSEAPGRALRRTAGLRQDVGRALAALPRERLAVYRDLVLGGHLSMTRYALGTTVDLLELVGAERPRLRRKPTHAEAIEAFLAEGRGPRTHSLRELAETFAAFLRERYDAAFRAAPLLDDVVRLELAELHAELEVDGPGRVATDEDLAALRRGTLDRLLRRKVLVPTYARLLRFERDVPLAVARLRRGEARRLADVEIAGPAHLVLARRPSDLATARIEPGASIWSDLRALGRGRAAPLEAFAARRARRGPRGETEDAAAARVVGEALGLLRDGALLLA